MIRVALIGLGKMGISHQAIINAHPLLQLVAVCDTNRYVLGVLEKYTGVRTYNDYHQLLAKEQLDAVVIASPSRFHSDMVAAAIGRRLHVFCEKPFCLDPDTGRSLAERAEDEGLITQVGYHFRFVSTFVEMRRLLAAGAIGELHHVQVEAYGPVVTKPSGSTWRSQKTEGGGCLYDYACHGLDLLNFVTGSPSEVVGATMESIFSENVDDQVYALLRYSNGVNAQLSANWSDPSFRKMSMKMSLWGSRGRMTSDRQELQIFVTDEVAAEDLRMGWNVRNTTELTTPVWYYLRGEEYSAQIDHFATCVRTDTATRSPFRTACEADRLARLISIGASQAGAGEHPRALPISTPRGIWARLKSSTGN